MLPPLGDWHIQCQSPLYFLPTIARTNMEIVTMSLIPVSVTLHLEQCVRISFENKRKSLEAIKSLTLTSDRMGEKMRSI